MSLSINVKGPSDLKLAITVPEGATVAELKGLITQANADYPVDRQRLIYSGRVLKDEELCSKYGLSNGHTIHLVKGAPPAASAPPPAAAQVPSSFAAGNQIAGNPLAPLLNAEYAGALGSFNPFAEMGINTNDPNYVQNMMDDPNVQNQINGLLQNPQVIDQIIAANPQLQAMGPQVRQMMQSEQFRSFLTNPESMRNMQQMMGSGMFGGAGGAGAAGGFPAPGGTGGNGALFNPWASEAPAAAAGAGAAGSPPAAGAQGAFNPFAALGGMGGLGGLGGAGAGAGAGGQPDFQQMMQQMQQLQQLQQQFGAPSAPAAASSAVPPEERFATQLAQLAELGFLDASRNVRALLAAGGNVEGAVEYLFSNP